MKDLLLPTHDETFIMTVAKSISHERLLQDSDTAVIKATGRSLYDDPTLLARLEAEFEVLWAGKDAKDKEVRDRFYNDAIAAINAINLHLLTVIEE